MTIYCTQADIAAKLPEATLIELTDDAAAGTVDSTVLDAAIDDAGEEIDAYLALKYSLPLAATPALVRKMAVDLVICDLYGRREMEPPKAIADRCTSARRHLEQLAKGTLLLDVPDPAADGDFGVESTRDADDRIFTIGRNGGRGSLDNY